MIKLSIHKVRIFVWLIATGLTLPATATQLFDLPEQNIDHTLDRLNRLDAYLEAHPVPGNDPVFVTLTESVATTIDVDELLITTPSGYDDTFQAVGSFCAGFCCGPIGIGAVFYITDKDPGMTEYSILGSMAALVTTGIFIGFIYVVNSTGF